MEEGAQKRGQIIQMRAYLKLSSVVFASFMSPFFCPLAEMEASLVKNRFKIIENNRGFTIWAHLSSFAVMDITHF